MELRIDLLIIVIVIGLSEFAWVLSQGIRGVIINNHKLDDSNISNPIFPKILSTQIETSTMRSIWFTPNSPIRSSEKHIHGFKRRPKPNRRNGESKNSETSSKNLNKIMSILNRNQTDLNKIDELVMQMNSTGSLTQINLINVNEKETMLTKPAPKIPSIESVYKDMDSKELKVQFVLDCDLRNSLDKQKVISSKPQMSRPTTKKPISTSQTVKKPIQSPSRVQPQVIYYPISPPSFYQNPYQAALTPTKYRPNWFPAASLNSVTKRKPTKVTTTKPKIHNVYVDPPAIATISDTFDNIYNYFEDVFTKKVKIPNKQSNRNQRAEMQVVNMTTINRKLPRNRSIVKRSTVSNSRVRPSTISPITTSTKFRSNDVQHLTTKIHVTSEYVGKDPTTTTQSSTITEEYSDEYDDDDGGNEDDDDYYDSVSFEGFGVDDDDDDDDSYDDEYDESSSVYDEDAPVKKKRKLNVTEKSDLKGTRPKKRKQKPQHALKDVGHGDYNRHDSYSDESSSEYSDMDFSLPYAGMNDFFNKMGSMFSPVGKYVPSFLNLDNDDYDDEDDNNNNNENQISQPNKIKEYLLRKGKNKDSVLRFFYSSGEETTTVTTPYASHEEQSTESSFFDWFSDNNNNKPSSTESTNPVPIRNWFSNIFGITEKPTTTSTTTQNPLNAQHLMAVLASQISTTPKSLKNFHQDRRIYYDDYQIWRISPSTNAHLEFLREYKSSGDGEHIQWLKGPSMRGPTDILVSPSMNKHVQEALEYESVPYEIAIWDLEKAIKYENPVMTRKQKIELKEYQGHPMTWYRYHDYDDILTYLDYLQITYPDNVDLIHIGRSFEGRPLVIVKISFKKAHRNRSNKNSNKQTKKKTKKVQRQGIFIEGGTHGREWISPAVTTWLLRELVEHNRTVSSDDSDLIKSVDWYILPVSNPDGYEYSLHYDRMWRKTRSKLKPNKPSVLTMALNWLQRDKAKREEKCYGTDPNRNFDVNWSRRGSSSSPCSDFYAGPKPFSEPETKNLAKFLDENKKLINLFLSLHSYGQMIMYPSTVDSRYSSSQKSNDLRDLAEIAANGHRDLSTGRYVVDSTNEMMDYASGTMTDYAMHETGIKYCYTIELRDSGTQGFLLSPTYIEANGKEIFQMIKSMIDYI